MREPPGETRPTNRNLTDLRPPKRDRRAEADRHLRTQTPLHRRATAAIRAAGFVPYGWMVRSLVATVIANGEDMTDEELAAWIHQRRGDFVVITSKPKFRWRVSS